MRHILRTFLFVLCALLGLVAAPASVDAAKRVALVIGNDDYRNLSPQDQLNNAVGDARAIRDTLDGLGFEVLYGENLDRGAMVDRMSDLAARLGEDDTAMVFYAGHGVAFSGANYLLPSDIPAPRATGRGEEGRLARQAIAEASVIEQIEDAGARVAIVVLDACRDNPLRGTEGRSLGASRGLTQSVPPSGVFLLYSAGFAQQALDRLGPDDDDPNSVFTRVFIDKIREPGIDLRALAVETRREVAALASDIGHRQTPAYYDQIVGGDAELVIGPTVDEAATGQAVSDEARPDVPAPRPVLGPAARAWGDIEDSESEEVMEAFLEEYPDGLHAALARERLRALRGGAEDADDAGEVDGPEETDGRDSNTAPAADPEPPAPEGPDLVLALQEELHRVGCAPGPRDGLWGRRTAGALARFVRTSGASGVSTDQATPDALAAVRERSGRVCPVQEAPAQPRRQARPEQRAVQSEQQQQQPSSARTEEREPANPPQPEIDVDIGDGGVGVCIGPLCVSR